MKNRRYSDENWHLWPFTFCKAHPHWFGVEFNSGAHEDGLGDSHIKFFLLGLVIICELPKIIKDHRERHTAKYWDAATIARMGRDWYDTYTAREYGFCFTGEGSLHVHYGPDLDGKDGHTKVFFLPWRSWRFIRCSFYDKQQKLFWTEYARDKPAWEAKKAVEQALPKVYFQMEDYDGEIVTATTHVEEREWRFGTGLFSWLSWFTRPKLRRDLSIEFSAEVGTEKGSWKGGVIGTSTDIVAGESHEEAFERFCEKRFRSKSGGYQVRYLGPLPILEIAPATQACANNEL